MTMGKQMITRGSMTRLGACVVALIVLAGCSATNAGTPEETNGGDPAPPATSPPRHLSLIHI